MTANRPPPFFIADNLGLDFLNSIAVPVDTRVEWLASGGDLIAWIKRAGLVPHDVLNDFRKNAAPGELDAIAAQARALRDWFKPFVYKHMGRPIEPNAVRQLKPLNQLLARDDEFGQIVVRNRLYKQEHGQGGRKRRVSACAAIASSSPGAAFFRKSFNTSWGTNPARLIHAIRSPPDASHSTLVSTGTAMEFKKSSPRLSAMKNGGGRLAVMGAQEKRRTSK